MKCVVGSTLKYFIHILQKIQKYYCFDKVVHSEFCCVTVLVANKQPSSVAYNMSKMLNEINKIEKCTSVFQSLKFHCYRNVSYINHCYAVILTSRFCSVTLNAHEFMWLLMSLDGKHINVGTNIITMNPQSKCALNVCIYGIIHKWDWTFSISHPKSVFYFLSISSSSEPAMS